MSHFTQLDGFPILDLAGELNRLLSSGVVAWDVNNQICLNTISGKEDDYAFGTGSLTHDWNNAKTVIKDGSQVTVVEKFPTPMKESDFTILCDQFVGTLFNVAYDSLSARFRLGRVRLMCSKSKTCLSWHVDDHVRVHYPMKTQAGCFMIIDDEVKHLTQDTWWLTNTLPFHTALNASKEDRIHLVATIIGNR